MQATGVRAMLLSAALMGGAPFLIAACGQQPSPSAGPDATSSTASPAATSSGSASPGTSGCSGAATPAQSGGTLTVTADDNGKTLCVRTGTAVLVFLHGSAASRWKPIKVSSPALAPHPNPAFTLALWVTGGSFLAAQPGTAVVTSSRPACGPASSPANVSPGTTQCPSVVAAFRVRLIITR